MPLPEQGEPKRAILDTYTKEHSAEYQSQALIDLARRMGPKIGDLVAGREHRHPHQPSHPLRDRHRRQRSAEDGPEGEPRNARPFDHVHLRRRAGGRRLASRDAPTRRSAPARPETVALWHKISTVEDPEWTRRYHSHDPQREGVRRPRRRHAEGRLGDRRRDRGRRCASAGRASLRAAALHREIPQPCRGRHRAGGAGSLPRVGRAAAEAEVRRACAASLSRPIRRNSVQRDDAGIFDWSGAAAGRQPAAE